MCGDKPFHTLKTKGYCAGQGCWEAGHNVRSIFKACLHLMYLKPTVDSYR